MCMIKIFNNKYLLVIESLAILAINIVHIVYGFSIKKNSFDPYDLFGSSPLFNFSISNNCEDKSAIIFHKWGGITKEKWTLDSEIYYKTFYETVAQTDIKKLW